MSYASDFGHDIPPDDWDGGSSRRTQRRRNYYTSIDYNRRTELKFEEILHETEKAYLFRCTRGKTWIPKSKIESMYLDKGKLYIPYWLSNNLVYFNDNTP